MREALARPRHSAAASPTAWPDRPPRIGVQAAPGVGDVQPFARGIDWDALEPCGFHARSGRRILNALLVVATFLPVIALGVTIALVNAIAFRSFRQVLFVQPRVGRRGRVFRIYKFRTMRESEGAVSASWFCSNDAARVTRLGRFLRSSHLDELPQCINILRGEMTFIGPRPEMVEVETWAAANVPGFTQRLVLTPGITGYAQITQGYTGCCVESYSRKLALTERYRTNLTLRMDLDILLRTVAWMLRGRGWFWKQNVGASEAAGCPPPREPEMCRGFPTQDTSTSSSAS